MKWRRRFIKRIKFTHLTWFHIPDFCALCLYFWVVKSSQSIDLSVCHCSQRITSTHVNTMDNIIFGSVIDLIEIRWILTCFVFFLTFLVSPILYRSTAIVLYSCISLMHTYKIRTGLSCDLIYFIIKQTLALLFGIRSGANESEKLEQCILNAQSNVWCVVCVNRYNKKSIEFEPDIGGNAIGMLLGGCHNCTSAMHNVISFCFALLKIDFVFSGILDVYNGVIGSFRSLIDRDVNALNGIEYDICITAVVKHLQGFHSQHISVNSIQLRLVVFIFIFFSLTQPFILSTSRAGWFIPFLLRL